jgi:hypothetical protein
MSGSLSALQTEAIRTAVVKCAADDVLSVAVRRRLDSQGCVEVLITRGLKGSPQESDQ